MFPGTLTRIWLGSFLCLPTSRPWSKHRYLCCGRTRPISLVETFYQKWDWMKTRLRQSPYHPIDNLDLQLRGLKRRWNPSASHILVLPRLRSSVVTTLGWRRREWWPPWGLGKHIWKHAWKICLEYLRFYSQGLQAVDQYKVCWDGLCVALIDTLSDSIQCLNFDDNWFNSIFDSILVSQNSIQTIIQFKINSSDSIQ